MRCGLVCTVFLSQNRKLHYTMRYGAVRCKITCGAVRLCHFVGSFGTVFAVCTVYTVW